jgi:transcriptional regulator with XRE-family HTH domain
MNNREKTSKDAKFRSFDDVHEEILREFPPVEKLWRETKPRRRISLMLVRLRKERGLSQKQIAERAGWDKAFVSRLESSSDRLPDSDTVARYAAACGLTAGVVIGEPDSSYMRVLGAVTLHSGFEQEQPNSFERLTNRRVKLNEELQDEAQEVKAAVARE